MRVVLTLILFLAAAPALAAWVKVIETNGAVNYIDPTTLQKNGNFQKVWTLQDLKARGPSGEMSRRLLEEYDCQGERNRTVWVMVHSGSMGGGRLILTINTPAAWEPMARERISVTTEGVVCASAGQPGGSPDTRADRREVRPGCSIIVFPGSKGNSNLRYTGGSCINGLLEGIVKIDGPNPSGTRIVSLHRYKAGRGVGLYLSMALVNGNWEYQAMDRDANGSFTAGAGCPGRNASERANGEAYCKAAALAFGANAFDTASMLSDQVTAGAGAGPSTGTGPVPGSASSGGWPAGVEPGNLYLVEYKYPSVAMAKAHTLVAAKSRGEAMAFVKAKWAENMARDPQLRGTPYGDMVFDVRAECTGPNWGAVVWHRDNNNGERWGSACGEKTPREAILAATKACSDFTKTSCDSMENRSTDYLIISVGHSGAKGWSTMSFGGYPPDAMRFSALGATTGQFSTAGYIHTPQDAINQFGKACGAAGVHSCWITSKNWACLNNTNTRRQGDCVDTKLTAEGYLQ